MSPRRYHRGRRDAAMEEIRRRIVKATVDLHARKGVLGTTYAMIAEHADVAVPTVYNHFPDRPALLAACTGHVAAQSPPLGPEMLEGLAGLEKRLGALVRALHVYYRFRRPWLRWAVHEAQQVPEIAKLLQTAAVKRRQLIALALAPAFGPEPPAPLLALADILLDFPAWQQLSHDQALSADAIVETLTSALIALANQPTGMPPSAGAPRAARHPTRRSPT